MSTITEVIYKGFILTGRYSDDNIKNRKPFHKLVILIFQSNFCTYLQHPVQIFSLNIASLEMKYEIAFAQAARAGNDIIEKIAFEIMGLHYGFRFREKIPAVWRNIS